MDIDALAALPAALGSPDLTATLIAAVAAAAFLAGWVDDLFTGTRTHGIYGSADIPTASGIATATVLPLGYPSTPVWPEWLDAALSGALDYLGEHWAVYDPLTTAENRTAVGA